MQQGNHHLGVPDSQAIERFINLLSHGLWASGTEISKSQSRDRIPEPEAENRSPLAAVASSNGAT
jgi:hypothetical protein